jgi:hypothetical protein
VSIVKHLVVRRIISKLPLDQSFRVWLQRPERKYTNHQEDSLGAFTKPHPQRVVTQCIVQDENLLSLQADLPIAHNWKRKLSEAWPTF